MQISMIPIGDSKGFGDTVKAFALLANVVRDECAEGVRFMSWYPPKSHSSHYVRTGTLRRSWSSNVKSGGSRIEGEVGSSSNIAPYNEDVQGENQDNIFERLGWRDVGDLESKINKSFPNRAQDQINKAYGGI